MKNRKRVICHVPSKVKELIVNNYSPSGTRRDKLIFATMVKYYITFPAKYVVHETDPEMEKVISAIEKNDTAEIGFSLTEFDFNHLKHVSDISFRSIIQQSTLALCSMAIYMKKNKFKSYQLTEDLKINFN